MCHDGPVATVELDVTMWVWVETVCRNRVALHALRMGFSALPPVAAPAASRRPARPCNPPPDRPAGPTRSGRPAVRTARPTGRAPRPSIARPGTWPDRPTRTAWPLPPLSAAQFAPSSLSGSSWHPSDSSRRSAAPTPCTLSQTRSSAGTLFGKKSPQKSRRARQFAGSHGSLFLSTSLNFDTVIILSLRARGEPGGGQSLPRRAPGDSKVSVRPVHVRPGCSGALPSCYAVAA